MQALFLMIFLTSAPETGPSTTLGPDTVAMPTAPVTQVALNSLRDLFHGKPEAQKKALPPKQKAVISWAASVARDAKVDAFLDAFASALMVRDAKGLEPLVASNYSIDGLPGKVSPLSVLRQAIEQSPGPTTIEIRSVTAARDGITATAEFRYEKQESKLRTLKLDGAGRLVWSDLFAVKVKTHDETARG
ncbi:MAG: hypothetical protein JNJ55_00560 [Betaproteobacteria bacterium]|nr:hypothetical protein [Betaproteobacteria bacterium]